MMNSAAIVFPHQLYRQPVFPPEVKLVYLVEEWLFFKQYSFHKQKLVFHRAGMQCYAAYLEGLGYAVKYINATDEYSDVRLLIPFLAQQGITALHYADTTDNWLEKRITHAAAATGIALQVYLSPIFINTKEDNDSFFTGKKRFFQADFYIHQRKRLNILVDNKQQPLGGQWSFDTDNRLKYPKTKTPPAVRFPSPGKYYEEAIEYVQTHFADNPGEVNVSFTYPITHDEAVQWLNQFLDHRLEEFGPYEDAIVEKESILHHSLLTPMLNTGLLLPADVVKATLDHTMRHSIPMNSTEGFIRQVIGWREFIRAVYEAKGTEERTRNYWGFYRKIPSSFYTGSTGIAPVDMVIKKVLSTGYCHHIERLMVLGNFMLLCEFHPDEVYRWFMELFIDAYDWVMVPNVYGMSQFADGGLMATKPYISGSNYILKMSDCKKGDWQPVWDALFWRFMHVHRSFFLQNPRLGMLIKTFEKMPAAKQQQHLQTAEQFLQSLC